MRVAQRITTIGSLLMAVVLLTSTLGCSTQGAAAPPPTVAEQAAVQKTESEIKLYAPVVLGFIAAWLTVGPIFSLLEKLHSLRDKVVLGPERGKFDVAKDIDIKYREAMIYNSYKPILYGWLVFFFVVFLLAVAVAPTLDYWLFKLVALAVALQYLLSFIGFYRGGTADIELMKEVIRVLQRADDPTSGSADPSIGPGEASRSRRNSRVTVRRLAADRAALILRRSSALGRGRVGNADALGTAARTAADPRHDAIAGTMPANTRSGMDATAASSRPGSSAS
jgi:hypothetical protein